MNSVSSRINFASENYFNRRKNYGLLDQVLLKNIFICKNKYYRKDIGKDLLKTIKVKNISTYWIKRDKQDSRMKKQF